MPVFRTRDVDARMTGLLAQVLINVRFHNCVYSLFTDYFNVSSLQNTELRRVKLSSVPLSSVVSRCTNVEEAQGVMVAIRNCHQHKDRIE
ncbi:hypothetical protein L596_004710 [Steinernema carpocapsae]|uniref:Uncharacterized protein n=1 Tax=Steinernema carpocapsae TaxID=34508 RepID=A0A4U8V082_STECR|nr:hypothetical protein L596_004710 [Steinernema carpocapsae]